MSYTSNKRQQVTVAAASIVVLIGATSVLLKTYPHLTPNFGNLYSQLTGKVTNRANSADEKEVKSNGDDSSLGESTVVVPSAQVSEWSEEELKSYLKQVR